jgi:hypothetical protein
METLLDRHLATFDRWLQVYFVSLTASSRVHHYYLAVVTLLDQLDPKEFQWRQVSVILQHQIPTIPPDKFLELFDAGTELNMEFIRMMSNFLMDQDRAGSLWVDSHKYAGLATFTLEILRDK